MKVTETDLLEALRDVMGAPIASDGMTGPELAVKLGCAPGRVRDALRVWIPEGRVEIVSLKRTAVDGRTMTIRGYRMKG